VIQFEKKDQLLTILVPTWNRRKDLANLLTVLIPQVLAQPDVNLIVSNNCSPDDTAEYLNRLDNRPQIRIIHQPTNLGGKIHLAWLYGQATGRFLWMIGDDDILEKDLVDLVCKELREKPGIGWIHLPGTHLLRQGPPLLTLCPSSYKQVEKGRLLFGPYISWIGWITSNIISTKLLHTNLPGAILDSDWWPQLLLMRSVADEPASVLAVRKLTAGAQSTWADQAEDILMRQFPQSILASNILTRLEIRTCLVQRYTDCSAFYRRLLTLDIQLFLRVTRACPSLLMLGGFGGAALRLIARKCLCGKKVLRPGNSTIAKTTK